ncbi:PAS domain-containing protein [Nocardia sp. MDA0666]|uniref:PAS domain-containing protein n=1 Tax=Nocardia sp. MDA0666 TaxID=2135448 RepID=UPI003513E012
MTHRWEWSEEVYRMYGYAPGHIEPTTKLMLAHKHPDDRDDVARAIDRAARNGEPLVRSDTAAVASWVFSSRHRFLDTAGRVHDAMVVSERVVDESGTPVGTTGFYIDLTDTPKFSTWPPSSSPTSSNCHQRKHRR